MTAVRGRGTAGTQWQIYTDTVRVKFTATAPHSARGTGPAPQLYTEIRKSYAKNTLDIDIYRYKVRIRAFCHYSAPHRTACPRHEVPRCVAEASGQQPSAYKLPITPHSHLTIVTSTLDMGDNKTTGTSFPSNTEYCTLLINTKSCLCLYSLQLWRKNLKYLKARQKTINLNIL